MKKSKITPGKWLYLVGVFVIVIGFVCGFRISLSNAFHMLNNSINYEATVPGKTDISFSQIGKYSISVITDNGDELMDLLGIKFEIIRRDDNRLIPISKKSYGSHSEFNIYNPGMYTFTAYYENGYGPDGRVNIKLIGQSSSNDISSNIIGNAGYIAGVMIIVVTYILRKRSKQSFSDENKDEHFN
jgi:hypothetical protein